MTQLDHQLGFADESTYGTSVAVTRFFEYDGGDIEEQAARTEGDPLRAGTYVARSDRFTPYVAGAAGSLSMAVLTKGFGYFLKHMLGAVATTGPAETSVYTHTGTLGELVGKSFTCQLNRPLYPTGTNQAFTYEGGKVTEWTLSNSVDERLMLELGLDFEQMSTATALAAASYPTNMDELTWAGGVVTIGGTAVDLDQISIKGSNNLAVDRRKIRQNTDKKEPTPGRREIEFSLSCDFESLAQRNRAMANTRAGALAQIVATWRGPTLLGTTLFPQLQVTLPAARFDGWKAAAEGTDGIQQELSGVVRFDGTNQPISMAYQTADTTP